MAITRPAVRGADDVHLHPVALERAGEAGHGHELVPSEVLRREPLAPRDQRLLVQAGEELDAERVRGSRILRVELFVPPPRGPVSSLVTLEAALVDEGEQERLADVAGPQCPVGIEDGDRPVLEGRLDRLRERGRLQRIPSALQQLVTHSLCSPGQVPSSRCGEPTPRQRERSHWPSSRAAG
jgi:hypothetical protein